MSLPEVVPDAYVARGSAALTEAVRARGTATAAAYYPAAERIVLNVRAAGPLLRGTSHGFSQSEAIPLLRDSLTDLAHEVEHAISPARTASSKIGWLEEGGAEVLATWPGNVRHMAARMHVPRAAFDFGFDGVHGYEAASSQVQTLLGLAGIDWRDEKERPAAVEMLQSSALADAPNRLAQAIGKVQHLTPEETGVVQDRIIKLGTSPKPYEAVERLERWVRRRSTSPSVQTTPTEGNLSVV